MDDFDAIARAQLAALVANNGPDNPVTPQQLAEAIRQYAVDQLDEIVPPNERVEQQGIYVDDDHVNEALEKGIELITDFIEGNPYQRVKLSDEVIQKCFDGEDPYLPPPDLRKLPDHKDFDIIKAISAHSVLTDRLGLFLPPRDLIMLYSISRDFFDAINGRLLSSIVKWLRVKAPNAVSDFPFKLYGSSTIRDPAGRTFAYEMYKPIPRESWVNDPRIVPTLRWYHMVVNRERYVWQITAFLARSGHRLPPTARRTLKRMWLIMDVASNRGRVGLMKNTRLWADEDLYNVQIFCVKLEMLFNDPIRGPGSDCMVKLMLGQRGGLFPLWQLLYRKKFNTLPELVELKVRYDYVVRVEHARLSNNGMTAFGLPLREVGRGHLEGWGVGNRHLYRPDELAMAESTRRRLDLQDHLANMALWGMVDWSDSRPAIPREEEIYLSDEDELLERVDTSVMFKMRHPMKRRWATLTVEQKEEIRIEERIEEMQAVKLARCTRYAKKDGTMAQYPKGELPVLRMTDKDNYNLNWETRRGWTVQHMTKEDKKEALEEMPLYERQPTEEEREELEKRVKDELFRAKDLVTEDEKLKAQAWYNYDEEDLDFDYEAYAADLDNGAAGEEMEDWGQEEEDEDEDVDVDVEEGQEVVGGTHVGELMQLFAGAGAEQGIMVGGDENGDDDEELDEEGEGGWDSSDDEDMDMLDR